MCKPERPRFGLRLPSNVGKTAAVHANVSGGALQARVRSLIFDVLIALLVLIHKC
jgi:hypothetical protein